MEKKKKYSSQKYQKGELHGTLGIYCSRQDNGDGYPGTGSHHNKLP